MKKIFTTLTSLALTLMLVACNTAPAAPASESSQAQETTVAAEATATEAKDEANVFVGSVFFENEMTLDPIKGAMSYGYPFINEALLRANKKSEYDACLAKSWEISSDSLTYTFQLEEGVKFSDGSDFDADDVVFTYNTVKENQEKNESVDLSVLKSVTAVDKYTVKFELEKPYSPFFDIASKLQIVPSDAYDSAKFDTMPIGTGAYKVAQYDPKQQIILVANDLYHGQAPALKKINFVNMDESAAFAAANSGNLDVVMVGTRYLNNEIKGMKLHKLETMDVRNINLPTVKRQEMQKEDGTKVIVGNDVTADKAVREALTIGIDRQTIINNALNGAGKPAVHFTSNLRWALPEGYEDNQVEKAKEILTNAGWVDTDNDGIREKDGQKLTFDIYAPGGDEDRYQLAAAVAENAKQLGFDIVVKTASWGELGDNMYTSGVVWGWGQYSPDVIANVLYSKNILNGYFNTSIYSNAQVDAAIEAAINSADQNEAIKHWQEAQALADKDFPVLYVVNIEHCYFVKDNMDISDATQIPHPHGHGMPVICNMADWHKN